MHPGQQHLYDLPTAVAQNAQKGEFTYAGYNAVVIYAQYTYFPEEVTDICVRIRLRKGLDSKFYAGVTVSLRPGLRIFYLA